MPQIINPALGAQFVAAKDALDPVLNALYMRIQVIRNALDSLTYQYCLNEPLCEHLGLADGSIDRFLRIGRFLDKDAEKASMTTRALAYNYRELIRVLFELHPALMELTRPTYEIAGMKKGAWETLQFKLSLATMELDRILGHPEFMEHAMVLEEIVMNETRAA